jgi:hypothetical protein
LFNIKDRRNSLKIVRKLIYFTEENTMTIQPSSRNFHVVNSMPLPFSNEAKLPYPSYPKKSISLKKLKQRTIALTDASPHLPPDITDYFPPLKKPLIALKGRKAA